jgi:Tfp pilus assembly protein PilF/heme A synthase
VSLKFIAYGCLFFLAAFYPFGFLQDQREVASLCRWAVIAVLAIGLLVGVIGLLRRLTDDDQSLWLFIPEDRQRYDLSAFRASGPFVDPDHFANYLNLILPFAVTGLLFPRLLSSRKYQFVFRWFCGLVALVLVAALVGSASRAGWIGAVVSIACLTWLCGYVPAESRPHLLRLKGQSRLLVPASLAGALMLALTVAGPLARTQADNRLSTTHTGDEFSVRLEVAEDSLRMVRDFPFLGVGLGCWADLFPRYCRPPWSSSWWGETHNDYLQLLAETGLLGFLCLGWVFARIGKELYIHCPATDSASFPIFAAIVSAVAATAFHEFVDFPLHLSANAFLFTLWLGLAVRIATSGDKTKNALEPGRRMANWSCAGVGIAALVLAVVAMVQGDEAFFPYEVGQLQTPAQVRDFMLAHPANSRAHLMLAKLMAHRMTPERLGEEANTALFLEPTNPLARDIHARSLFARNQEARALKEITRSVFFSPTAASHFYLAAERVTGLSMRERAAVEEGFEMAVERRFPDAVQGLGDFYHSLGEPSKESRAYMNGAAVESDPALRAQYLINAGLAFSRAKEWSGAEDALQKAAELAPNNPTPYQVLITVYGAARDMAKAKAVVAQGREGGVQPFPLYSALAQLQINSGDTAGAQASLLEAVKYRPADFQTLLYLGQVYMQRQEFERAIIWLKRAVESNPGSADALAQLAEAEQSSYHYFEADRTYRKALQLAPANASLRAEYGAFQRKIRQAQRDAGSLQ